MAAAAPTIAMQLAETLGISAEDINPRVVDTDSVGYNDGTGGSRVTFATGYAAYELGLGLRRRMCEELAELWDVSVDEIVFESGEFSCQGLRATFRRPLRNWQASMCRLSPAYRLAFGRRAWLCHAHRRRGS